jgi:hypothetical protein
MLAAVAVVTGAAAVAQRMPVVVVVLRLLLQEFTAWYTHAVPQAEMVLFESHFLQQQLCQHQRNLRAQDGREQVS